VRWPFASSENTAAIVDSAVLYGAWIAIVTHNADDGGWQFLSSNQRSRVEDGAIMGLREVIEQDPTLLELADLPEGWIAVRESPSAPWFRKENVDL
jgi:hypothetical protein